MESLAAERAEAPALGDVATRLLFENERVKVWEMLLAPGEASAPHRHGCAYFFVVLEGESIDADLPDGRSFHLPVSPGQVIYLPGGNAETAVNRSAVRYREVLVELKDHPAAPAVRTSSPA